MRIRDLILLAGLWVLSPWARGEGADELARIHTEAIGGKTLLQQWRAMRATGAVMTDGIELDFELIAARPNRVRVVVRTAERALLQATDGVVAWQQELNTGAPPRAMAPAETRDFLADAEFDDPLTSGAERGYTFDYAGQVQWREQSVFKILVTRAGDEPSFLLLDPETFFIVARITARRSATGRTVKMETRYDDFRPVGGVILPHDIRVYSDGKLLRRTTLRHVLPILEPTPDVFQMPAR